MIATVDATIADLRHAMRVQTDSDLARKIGVDKSTISGWRARGRVPARFMKLIQNPEGGVLPEPPELKGELQDRAQAVALMRFTLLRRDLSSSGDVDRALRTFRDLKPFWLVLHRAVHELRLKMEASGVDLATAQALMMQEDLRDPDATTSRVEAQLAEDLADNPQLENWK